MDKADLARFVVRTRTAMTTMEKLVRTALVMRGADQDTALWEAIDTYAWSVAMHAMARHRADHTCLAGLPETPDLDHESPDGGDPSNEAHAER